MFKKKRRYSEFCDWSFHHMDESIKRRLQDYDRLIQNTLGQMKIMNRPPVVPWPGEEQSKQSCVDIINDLEERRSIVFELTSEVKYNYN
jgi:hypothetical protein